VFRIATWSCTHGPAARQARNPTGDTTRAATARVDSGLFEVAGFRFHADTYRPGAEGCCFLHIRPGA
jgi:hypothetical protein